ncbi:MAG: protein kinase [Phycisphaerales bacterium]|nr:protein kinase [Phycisphaerales bacterium]
MTARPRSVPSFATTPMPPPPPHQPNPAGMPRTIGEYDVQRVLGAGGMATVYAALQRQPRRTVAIKVMRSAANAKSAMHRFKREIEILGRLRHPYIAQVYDAGIHVDDTGSVPYFVMEYVPGAKTIIEYATARELSLRDRVKLFIKVCAAVENGHLNKIIHRDLKPGNILIDENADPKVIDFGVARATEFDLTSSTMHTEEGRLIGTIQYMAPEQLEPTRQNLDARCDVYALGILLYKLLTGRPPYDLKGMPVFTAAQVIREDAPPKPSSLRPELKGDLETIILKALAKERERRYRTAGSLGRDLVRYLADKPIKARDAGLAYRVRLFARRHRTELIAAAVVGVVIVIAAAVLIQQQSRLDRVTPPPDDLVAGTPPGPPPAPVTTPMPANPEPAPLPDPVALTGHGAAITGFAASPDRPLLASVSADARLIVWDLERAQPRFTAADHDASIVAVAFSPAGDFVGTVDDAGRIVVVTTNGGRVERTHRHDCGAVHGLALAPGGAPVAVACAGFTVRVIGGDRPITCRGSAGSFRCVAFSPDGRLVAAGSDGGVVSVWDAVTGVTRHRDETLRDPIVAIAFTPAGALVTLTDQGLGRRWHPDGAEAAASFAVGLAGLRVASFDAAGGTVAAASADEVTVWDIDAATPLLAPRALEEAAGFTAVALTADRDAVAVGDAEGTVHLLGLRPVP